MGWGLTGLAMAALLSTIISRAMARRLLLAPKHDRHQIENIRRIDRDEMVSVLWHNASRYGTVLIGAFLIGRANILIASSTLGLSEAASYALAVQLLVVLQGLAAVPFNLSIPRMNALRTTEDISELYRCFSRTISLGLLVSILGASILVIFGPQVLNAVGSRTQLPHIALLTMMAISCVLEINHGNCGNFLATSNTISFVRPAIFTGVLIVAISASTVSTFGSIALVLSNLICQVAYNNWKWPLEAAKHFDTGFMKIVQDGIRQIFVDFPLFTRTR
jgi:O-antigen/teichoic acid export membrane protein